MDETLGSPDCRERLVVGVMRFRSTLIVWHLVWTSTLHVDSVASLTIPRYPFYWLWERRSVCPVRDVSRQMAFPPENDVKMEWEEFGARFPIDDRFWQWVDEFSLFNGCRDADMILEDIYGVFGGIGNGIDDTFDVPPANNKFHLIVLRELLNLISSSKWRNFILWSFRFIHQNWKQINLSQWTIFFLFILVPFVSGLSIVSSLAAIEIIMDHY